MTLGPPPVLTLKRAVSGVWLGGREARGRIWDYQGFIRSNPSPAPQLAVSAEGIQSASEPVQTALLSRPCKHSRSSPIGPESALHAFPPNPSTLLKTESGAFGVPSKALPFLDARSRFLAHHSSKPTLRGLKGFKAWQQKESRKQPTASSFEPHKSLCRLFFVLFLSGLKKRSVVPESLRGQPSKGTIST